MENSVQLLSICAPPLRGLRGPRSYNANDAPLLPRAPDVVPPRVCRDYGRRDLVWLHPGQECCSARERESSAGALRRCDGIERDPVPAFQRKERRILLSG